MISNRGKKRPALNKAGRYYRLIELLGAQMWIGLFNGFDLCKTA